MTTSSAKLLVFVSDKLACIKIQGRADFTSSIDFKALLDELIRKEFVCFILDLSDCVLMDSTFLGVLTGFGLQLKDSQVNGTRRQGIELLNPNSRISDLLENLGVMHLFHVVSGPAPESLREASEHAPAPTGKPTREQVTRNCLEAHRILMAIDPANVSKFKEVAQFLGEDLKKLKGAE
jgi:anti-sigma B factor antagonist